MLSLHGNGQMPLDSVIFLTEVQIRRLEVFYKASLGGLLAGVEGKYVLYLGLVELLLAWATSLFISQGQFDA